MNRFYVVALFAVLIARILAARAAASGDELQYFVLENPKKDYGFSAKVMKLHGDGMALMTKGKCAEAAAKFDAALKEMPTDPMALANRGVCEEKQKRYDAAIADYTAALKFAPELAPIVEDSLGKSYLERGRARVDERDGDGAMSDYRESLKHRKGAKRAPAYAEIAYLFSMARDFPKCVDAGTKAVAADPAFSDGWTNRGACLTASGRAADGVKDMDRAIALSPENAQLYISRAAAFQDLGRCREARADRDKVLALDPGYKDVVAGVDQCRDAPAPPAR